MPDRSEVEAVPREFVPVDFADAFIRVHPWHPCSNWMRSHLAGRGCESGDFCRRVLSDESWIFEQVGGANGDEPVSPVAIAVSEAAHPRRSPRSFGGIEPCQTLRIFAPSSLKLSSQRSCSRSIDLGVRSRRLNGSQVRARPLPVRFPKGTWPISELGYKATAADGDCCQRIRLENDAEQDAGPNDEERGQPRVPRRWPFARSSSSFSCVRRKHDETTNQFTRTGARLTAFRLLRSVFYILF